MWDCFFFFFLCFFLNIFFIKEVKFSVFIQMWKLLRKRSGSGFFFLIHCHPEKFWSVRVAVSRAVHKLHESCSRFFLSFSLFFLFLTFRKTHHSAVTQILSVQEKILKKKNKKSTSQHWPSNREGKKNPQQQLPSTFEFPGLSSYRTHVSTKVLPHQHPLKVKPLNERYIGSGCVR